MQNSAGKALEAEVERLRQRVSEVEASKQALETTNRALRAKVEVLGLSEERFKTFFDFAPVGKAITGADGKLLLVNASFGEFLGYTEEEMAKIPFATITHPEDVAESVDHVRRTLSGEFESFTIEKRYLHKDGHAVWALVTTRLRRDQEGKPEYFLTHIIDIDEAKRARQALAESETRYRVLTEAAQDHIFVISDERMTFVNDAGARFLHKSVDEVQRRHLDALFPPEVRIWQREAFSQALGSGKPVNRLQCAALPSGDRWLDFTIVPLVDHSVPGTVMGIARDVTEKVLAERQYEAIIKTTMDGFWLTSNDGTFLDVNEAYLEKSGYTRGEFLALHVSDVDVNENEDDVDAHLRKIHKTGGDRFEARHRKKDGTTFDVEVTVSPLQDGIVVVFVRDITERKRQLEELARLAHITASSSDMLAFLDRDFVYRAVNREYLAAFEKEADAFISHTASEVFGQGFFDEVIRPHAERCFEGETVRYQEWFDFPAYEPRWMEITYSPHFDENQQLMGLTVNGRDMTAQKRAEDELRALNTELDRRVAERTIELTAANKELEAFAYSVSHDLRAPLRGVDGFSKALMDDYGDALDSTAKDYIKRVRAGTQRMGRLIDDLLELSRMTRSEMHHQSVDLTGLAEKITAELQSGAPERDVTFVIERGLKAQGDRVLLETALENLLGNAWKFTNKKAHARIELGVQVDSGETVFFVRDNGAGFEMAYIEKLFGAFQRLHDTNEFPGTGVGLAIVQRVMQRHGGRAWAEGSVGEGATFYFALPAAPRS